MADFEEAIAEAGFNGGEFGVGDIGDFVEGEFSEDAEGDGVALIFGEGLEEGGDAEAIFFEGGGGDGVDGGMARGEAGELLMAETAAAVGAEVVVSGIAGDGEEPGDGAAGVVFMRGLAEDFEEDFLGEILGGIEAVDALVEVADEALFVAVDEEIETIKAAGVNFAEEGAIFGVADGGEGERGFGIVRFHEVFVHKGNGHTCSRGRGILPLHAGRRSKDLFS